MSTLRTVCSTLRVGVPLLARSLLPVQRLVQIQCLLQIQCLCLALILPELCGAQTAKAEQEQSAVFLDQAHELPFSVSRGVFLLELFDGSLLRAPATILSPSKSQVVQPAADGTGATTTTIPESVWFGASIHPRLLDDCRVYSLLIEGTQGELFLSPSRRLASPRRERSEEDALRRGGLEELRSFVIARKRVQRSFEMQIELQEQQLDQLRIQADTLADLKRMLEVQDEIERVRDSIQNVAKDAETLRRFIRLAKNLPTPKGFAQREALLTRQVSELADAATAAERMEGQRRAMAQSALERNLALIESTRYDDYDALQEELLALRRKRMQQERAAPPPQAGPTEGQGAVQ